MPKTFNIKICVNYIVDNGVVARKEPVIEFIAIIYIKTWILFKLISAIVFVYFFTTCCEPIYYFIVVNIYLYMYIDSGTCFKHNRYICYTLYLYQLSVITIATIQHISTKYISF